MLRYFNPFRAGLPAQPHMAPTVCCALSVKSELLA
jgi:hypothetical protein